MQNFTFQTPTEIVFGRNAELQVAKKIRAYGGHRVYLVYGGNSAIKTGLLSRVECQLTAEGLAFQVLGGVRPNPRLSLVREGIREAIAFECDFILGVGGGSVLDSAKAIAIGAANPGKDIWDFWKGNLELTKRLPIATIPTLAAAGSELSDSAVLTNEDSGEKLGLNVHLNRPTVSFLNPELTYTVPHHQVACGAADIYMHTLERYFTPQEGPNVFTDLVSEALLKNVMVQAKAAMIDHRNYDTMSELLWAAGVSHCGFTGLGRGKDFTCHKLGQALSARFDTNHGESLTAIWGAWARFVLPENAERFAQYAEHIFGVNAGTAEERARCGIRKTEEFFKSLGMPLSLGELPTGVLKESTLRELAAYVTADNKKTVGRVHPLNEADALKVYQMANH